MSTAAKPALAVLTGDTCAHELFAHVLCIILPSAGDGMTLFTAAVMTLHAVVC